VRELTVAVMSAPGIDGQNGYRWCAVEAGRDACGTLRCPAAYTYMG